MTRSCIFSFAFSLLSFTAFSAALFALAYVTDVPELLPQAVHVLRLFLVGLLVLLPDILSGHPVQGVNLHVFVSTPFEYSVFVGIVHVIFKPFLRIFSFQA